MNRELRESDRRWEVRRAAEGWRTTGAIDDATLAGIEQSYPDDRHRARPAFRALFFVFTLFAGLGVLGFGFMIVEGGSRGAARYAGLLAVMAAAFAVAAWAAIERLRLRRFGVEEGLVALALGCAAGAVAAGLGAAEAGQRSLFIAVCATLAATALAAAWRWGIVGTGLAAAGGFFAVLAWLPFPRPLWIVAGALLAVAARRLGRSAATAAAHRRRADEVFVVAVLALYVGVHVSLAVEMAFDAVGQRLATPTPLPPALATLAWIGMAALPAALVVAGLRRRERLELGLGTVLALATATSAVDALPLGPHWALLLAGGVVVGAIALAVRNVFARRADRTLGGFTDAEIQAAAAGGSWLELAASLAVFAPAPRREVSAGWEGGGGEFGGGGASGGY